MSNDVTGADKTVHPRMARVTPNLLNLLGIEPVLGRSFVREDGTGAADVVMLSHGSWQTRFGGRADVLGQKVLMNGKSFTVVGVTPPGDSALPDWVELFTPFEFPEPSTRKLLGPSLLVYARLKQGVRPAQAQAEMAAIVERVAQAHPQTRGWAVNVTSLTDAIVEPVPPPLLSLLNAVGFLMFITSANVANLLLLRATGRSRRIAIRTTLGARPGHVVRQILTLTLLVSFAGCAIGVLIAHVGLWALLGLAPETTTRTEEISVDGRALAFTVALAILTSIGYGLLPALHEARVWLRGR
jgi:putative ABC transport system permease protein